MACHQRKQESIIVLDKLKESGMTSDILRREWKSQVTEQTKPLIRQSHKLADKIIHEVLTLKSSHDSYQTEISRYEEMLATGVYEHGMDIADVTLHLEDLQKKKILTRKAIDHKRASLDVDGRLSLQKLLNNKFLQVRMNALALKNRIRSRLRQRKFELEGLERAYRHTTNCK